MLVDSSVWIGFFRGDRAPEIAFLKSSLERGDPVWLTPPVLQEVLQGADSKSRFAKWDSALGELPILGERDGRAMARDAALLYARCRWQGFTPRSANDCLIASYAIHYELPVLHRDRDFVSIAAIEPTLKLLKIDSHTP